MFVLWQHSGAGLRRAHFLQTISNSTGVEMQMDSRDSVLELEEDHQIATGRECEEEDHLLPF